MPSRGPSEACVWIPSPDPRGTLKGRGSSSLGGQTVGSAWLLRFGLLAITTAFVEQSVATRSAHQGAPQHKSVHRCIVAVSRRASCVGRTSLAEVRVFGLPLAQSAQHLLLGAASLTEKSQDEGEMKSSQGGQRREQSSLDRPAQGRSTPDRPQPPRTKDAQPPAPNTKSAPKPPLPEPPTSCEKMNESQLNDWVQALTKELELYSKLVRAFAGAAKTASDRQDKTVALDFKPIPPKIKDYLEKILGKHLDPNRLSAADLAACTRLLTPITLYLADRLSEAAEEELMRAFGEKKGDIVKKRGT